MNILTSLVVSAILIGYLAYRLAKGKKSNAISNIFLVIGAIRILFALPWLTERGDVGGFLVYLAIALVIIILAWKLRLGKHSADGDIPNDDDIPKSFR